MKTIFLDVPVGAVDKPEDYVERDTQHIYPHLKHFLSLPRPFPLPAVQVGLRQKSLVLKSRAFYWQIARELGKATIRAALEVTDVDTGFLGRLPKGVRLIPDEVLRNELAVPVVRGWHVYFFDGPLSENDRRLFQEKVYGFFEELKTPLIDEGVQRTFLCEFLYDCTCAQFEVLIPIADKSWFKTYRNIGLEFSKKIHRIVSFQGARFVP